jgi:hypothetical protein
MERMAGNEADIRGLALRMAAQEAASAGFSEITTAHLLISLSRLTDGEAASLAPAVSEALREEFEKLGIEPKRFRRRLRALLGRTGADVPSGEMHRSTHCKAVFVLAAAMAAQERAPLRLPHLLHAILISLAAGLVTTAAEIECPTCGTKMHPLVVGGAACCSACGNKVNSPPEAAPADEIPDEL